MTVLLLAGTAEARAFADLLAKAGIKALASFSGATENPRGLEIPSRSGGFGGEAEQKAFMKEHGIKAVINATHPYAIRISERSARLSASLGIPYVNLLRPEWHAGQLDNWTQISSGFDAESHIPMSARVFLATGRQTLPAFKNLTGRHLVCRVIDAPKNEFPYPNGIFVTGKPPFSMEREIALFEKHGIEWLVTKNSGGPLGVSKLVAAQKMAIPVLMIKRPVVPPGEIVTDAKGAMVWLEKTGVSELTSP